MFYEDFEEGDTFTTPAVEVSEEEILEFARRYDPQPFHVDPEAAQASIYGGLIASGWHVMAASFREVVRLGLFADGGQGAPGIEDLRWLRPVRPGDTLRVTVTIDDKRVSGSRPDRGYVLMRFEIVNQADELVSSYRTHEIFRRRGSDSSA